MRKRPINKNLKNTQFQEGWRLSILLIKAENDSTAYKNHPVHLQKYLHYG
jgi:hypothetical protein